MSITHNKINNVNDDNGNKELTIQKVRREKEKLREI